jgi:hypothetical protein
MIFCIKAYTIEIIASSKDKRKIKDILIATTVKAQKKELLVSGVI